MVVLLAERNAQREMTNGFNEVLSRFAFRMVSPSNYMIRRQIQPKGDWQSERNIIQYRRVD